MSYYTATAIVSNINSRSEYTDYTLWTMKSLFFSMRKCVASSHFNTTFSIETKYECQVKLNKTHHFLLSYLSFGFFSLLVIIKSRLVKWEQENVQLYMYRVYLLQVVII